MQQNGMSSSIEGGVRLSREYMDYPYHHPIHLSPPTPNHHQIYRGESKLHFPSIKTFFDEFPSTISFPPQLYSPSIPASTTTTTSNGKGRRSSRTRMMDSDTPMTNHVRLGGILGEDNGLIAILSNLSSHHPHPQRAPTPVTTSDTVVNRLGGLPVKKRDDRCEILPWEDLRTFLCDLTNSSSLENGHPERRYTHHHGGNSPPYQIPSYQQILSLERLLSHPTTTTLAITSKALLRSQSVYSRTDHHRLPLEFHYSHHLHHASPSSPSSSSTSSSHSTMSSRPSSPDGHQSSSTLPSLQHSHSHHHSSHSHSHEKEGSNTTTTTRKELHFRIGRKNSDGVRVVESRHPHHHVHRHAIVPRLDSKFPQSIAVITNTNTNTREHSHHQRFKPYAVPVRMSYTRGSAEEDDEGDEEEMEMEESVSAHSSRASSLSSFVVVKGEEELIRNHRRSESELHRTASDVLANMMGLQYSSSASDH